MPQVEKILVTGIYSGEGHCRRVEVTVQTDDGNMTLTMPHAQATQLMLAIRDTIQKRDSEYPYD